MTQYVAGGNDAEQAATSGVEQYDPVKDEWTPWKTPLTKKLSDHHLLNVVFYSSDYLDNLHKPDWKAYIEQPLCTRMKALQSLRRSHGLLFL